MRNVIVVGGMPGGVVDIIKRRREPRRSARRHPRLRRPHRQAVWTFHTSHRRASSATNLVEGFVVLLRQRRRLGLDGADEELGYVYLPTETPTGDY